VIRAACACRAVLPSVVGIDDDVNLYSYVRSDPLNLIDPSGKTVVVVTTNGGRASDYDKARAYLAGSATARTNASQLERSKHTYTIIVDPSAERPAHSFDPKTRTITFNPTVGLQLDDGSVQSAALGLGHEEAHAARLDADPQGYKADRKPSSSKMEVIDGELVVTWGTPREEQRATAVESEIAEELGEPTRSTHSEGTEVKVPSPTFSCVKSQCPQ
jgi:hypothetical protein